MLKQTHAKALDKLAGGIAKSQAELREKDIENRKLEKKRRELEESVAVRMSIKATRASGQTTEDATDKLRERMKVCFVLLGVVQGLGVFRFWFFVTIVRA